MKIIFTFLVLFCFGIVHGANKVTVAYFGRISEQEFSEKIKPVFTEMAQCKDCEIVNSTPYNSEFKVDDKKIAEKLAELDGKAQIIFFDYNRPSDSSEKLLEELQKLRSRSQVLVASAGAPEPDDKTCPLNMTIFGRVDEAVIVGELIQKDVLWPKCFFGPQMLTAVRPPKDYMGKGVGPLIFTARFAAQFNKKNPNEWITYFRTKKSKSRKLWPEVEDFFPR